MPVQLTRPRAGWAGPRRHRHGYSHEGGDRRRTPRPSGGAIPSSSTLRPQTAHPLQRRLGAGGGTGTQVGVPSSTPRWWPPGGSSIATSAARLGQGTAQGL